MVYLTVLYIEFIPLVVERFKGRVNLPGMLASLNKIAETGINLAERTLGRFISLFLIAGVVLSCLHQSSLGTLMTIAPSKMHPLWYTPISPLLFLLSAIAVGFPMVIFESLLASRSFGLKPELSVLSRLARLIPVTLGVYLAAKITDLTLRGGWSYLGEGSPASFMFMIEVGAGVILPIALLLIDSVRKSTAGLFLSACLVILVVALNRINVFLVAYNPPYADHQYYPSPFEIAVTIGLIALLVLVYRACVMIFPVMSIPVRAGATLNADKAVAGVASKR
jgi:Ni/Fe-hydrogenase subunit HybB-like protein